jgi:hypothetical protein
LFRCGWWSCGSWVLRRTRRQQRRSAAWKCTVPVCSVRIVKMVYGQGSFLWTQCVFSSAVVCGCSMSSDWGSTSVKSCIQCELNWEMKPSLNPVWPHCQLQCEAVSCHLHTVQNWTHTASSVKHWTHAASNVCMVWARLNA